MTTDGAPEFRQYRRTAIAEMADWHPGLDMTEVSVSEADRKAGSPKLGDKIARNPDNHEDRWLIAAAYFAANFQPLGDGSAGAEARRRLADTIKTANMWRDGGAMCRGTHDPRGCSGCAFRAIADAAAALLAGAPEASAPAEMLEESAGDQLTRLGMDGAKWAAEFRATARKLGYSNMDEGWLIGWFANAIMAGYDEAQRRSARAEAPAVPEDVRERALGNAAWLDTMAEMTNDPEDELGFRRVAQTLRILASTQSAPGWTEHLVCGALSHDPSPDEWQALTRPMLRNWTPQARARLRDFLGINAPKPRSTRVNVYQDGVLVAANVPLGAGSAVGYSVAPTGG